MSLSNVISISGKGEFKLHMQSDTVLIWNLKNSREKFS